MSDHTRVNTKISLITNSSQSQKPSLVKPGHVQLQGDMITAALFRLYSRSLRPGGVLLKLAVVDSKVRSEVTAVTQRRDTAAEEEK